MGCTMPVNTIEATPKSPNKNEAFSSALHEMAYTDLNEKSLTVPTIMVAKKSCGAFSNKSDIQCCHERFAILR